MRSERRHGARTAGWLAACVLASTAACGGDPATPLSAVGAPATTTTVTGGSCTAGVACTSTSGPCVLAAIACSGGRAVCTDLGPAPDGTACGTGHVCAAGACVVSGQAANACTNPIAASAAPAADAVQHFASVRVGSSIDFDVPANTISITVIEQAVDAPATVRFGGATVDNTAVPLRIVQPGGSVVFDDTTSHSSMTPAEITALPAFFAAAAPGTGTLTIPNTTGGLALIGPTGLPGGTWSLAVSDYAYECTLPQFAGACFGASSSSTYDVTVTTKPGASGAVPPQGSIDVAIYFATTSAGSGAPLSAATANAGNDPDLNRMAQSLRTLLGRAGVTVSSITYRDLPAAVQALYATGVNVDTTGTCSDLASLLRQSGPGNLLDVFFVSTFTSSLDSTATQVVGIDGTIPGPATVGGTGASGAAVATHDLRAGTRACTGTSPSLACGADLTAYIIAHEAGHFLGLYHVTESDGAHFDPLQDTPMCPCASCAPAGSQSSCATATSTPASPYTMQVSDCIPPKSSACGGGDNLMFWVVDQGSTGTLTLEQQRVIRANPLVH